MLKRLGSHVSVAVRRLIDLRVVDDEENLWFLVSLTALNMGQLLESAGQRERSGHAVSR